MNRRLVIPKGFTSHFQGACWWFLRSSRDGAHTLINGCCNDTLWMNWACCDSFPILEGGCLTVGDAGCDHTLIHTRVDLPMRNSKYVKYQICKALTDEYARGFSEVSSNMIKNDRRSSSEMSDRPAGVIRHCWSCECRLLGVSSPHAPTQIRVSD